MSDNCILCGKSIGKTDSTFIMAVDWIITDSGKKFPARHNIVVHRQCFRDTDETTKYTKLKEYFYTNI